MSQTRSKTMQAPRQEPARLWLLAPGFPGPAIGAVLAALPCAAKRCLRATCRAARDAVDAHACSICVPQGCLVALPAAAPRLQRLRRLDCRIQAPKSDDCNDLLAALQLLPPSLGELRLSHSHGGWLPAELEALAAALAARSALRRLEIDCDTASGDSAWLRGVAAQLPHLEELSVSTPNRDRVSASPPLKPPPLELPWRQLQSLSLSGGASRLLPQLLARRDVPALRELNVNSGPALNLGALWAAPWLCQLTRLDVACEEDKSSFLAGAPPLLPALQELRVAFASAGMPLAAAHRLAATQMPALRHLKVHGVAAGGVPVLAGAPWVSSLQALSLTDCDDRRGNSAAVAARALAAAPLGALTHLEMSCIDLAARAAPLAALLAAPWAAGLRQLDISAAHGTAPLDGTAARALAAARLPALRSLRVQSLELCVMPELFVRAPWLPQLEKLALCYDKLTMDAAAAFAACNLACLQELELRDVRLSGRVLTALSAAAWLPRLQRLRLVGHVDAACSTAVARGECGLRKLRARGGEVDVSLFVRGPWDDE